MPCRHLTRTCLLFRRQIKVLEDSADHLSHERPLILSQLDAAFLDPGLQRGVAYRARRSRASVHIRYAI